MVKNVTVCLPNQVEGDEEKARRGDLSDSDSNSATTPPPTTPREPKGSIFAGFGKMSITNRGSVFGRRWSLGSVAESIFPSDRRNSANSTASIDARNRFEKGFTMVEEEELGIAFCTRAKMRRKEERNKEIFTLMQWICSKLSPSSPQKSTTWHVFVSRQLSTHLRSSAMISFVLITCIFALEPICVSSDQGPLFTRISTAASALDVVATLHFVNSLLYLFGSMAFHAHFCWWDESALGVFDITPQFSSRRRCAFHLKSLSLDLLAFFGWVAEMVHLGQSSSAVPSVVLWLMLLQLIKLWRFVVPTTFVLDSRADSFALGLASSFFLLVLMSHLAGVVLLALAAQERAANTQSWIDNMVAAGESCIELYEEAFYFSSLSVTSVGYGDVLVTPAERGLNSFLLILGQLFVAKVCADVTWLTSLHNIEETKNQSQKAQTSVALRHLQVPGSLEERVLAYQDFVQHVHREEDLDQPAFHGLSTPLIQELRLAAYRKLILKAPFLREQKKHVISLMVNSLSDLVYLPADFIVCSGDTGRELFFMRRGMAGVYPSGPECPPVWGESSEVAEYTAGKYFGELGMLTARPRAAWIMAKTYCVLSVLPYHTVEIMRDEYPEAFTTLVQSMVRVFKLEPSTSWQHVAERLLKKVKVCSTEEAFEWFCDQGNGPDVMPGEEPILKAKSFEWVLKYLGVNEADRMILWAEMDADNTGQVSRQEFEEKLDIDWALERQSKVHAEQNSLLRKSNSMAASSGGVVSPGISSTQRYRGSKDRVALGDASNKEELHDLLRDTVRQIADEYLSSMPSVRRGSSHHADPRMRPPTTGAHHTHSQ